MLILIKRKLKHKSEMSKTAKKKKKTNLLDLPSDLLLEILTRLDHTDRLTFSLVSKFFQTLIDANFVRQLKFDLIPSNSTFRKLFSRFTSVNRIALKHFTADLSVVGCALVEISSSQLKIESFEVSQQLVWVRPLHMDILFQSGKFKMVKVLKLHRCYFLNHSDYKFISLFPFLEELDCSEGCFWFDVDIEILVSKVSNLRKINLNGNCHLTDESLDALGNCVYLEDVNFEGCNLMTLQGLNAFIRKRKNLKSLNLPYDPSEQVEDKDGVLMLAEAISNCANLTHISIPRGLMRDVFLSIIAKSRSSFTSLTIGTYAPRFDIDYSFEGVSAMVSAYPGLTKLCVILPFHNSATYDTKMSNLVKSLPRLKDVYILSLNPVFGTLFSLIQNCRILEKIHLKSLNNYIDKPYDVPRVLRKNYSIQQIHLEFMIPYALDRRPSGKIKAIKSSCPALKTLDCYDHSLFWRFL